MAQQKLSSYNPDRDEPRVVHAGQWLHRSDPLARANPHQVRAAEPFTP